MKDIKEEDLVSQGDEKIRVGTRIIKQLSTTFYPKPEIIFDELVSNARDAMASTVMINIEKDKITVEDDGEGMSHDGLVRFFYISHTKKSEEKRIRSFKGVKRHIIGKFGIGKISLYQICKKFKVSTWRDGVESTASFDFEKFEEEEFIDSFDLQVSSRKTDDGGSGTKITLFDLKGDALKRVGKATRVKRHLIKTMPITADFKIILKGPDIIGSIELKAENLMGRVRSVYKINEEVDDVGEVYGNIFFFQKEAEEEWGVYIKVFDRLVNIDAHQGVINFNRLTSPRNFVNKIRVELNANGLDDALLTNRSGFITSHEKYEVFHAWLWKKIKKVCKEEIRLWDTERHRRETKILPAAVSDSFSYLSQGMTIRDSEPVIKEKQGSVGFKEKTDTGMLALTKRGELTIETRELDITEPEAIYDKENQVLIINSSNPSYKFAKTQGRLGGVTYHIFKASAVLIAMESATSVREFKEIYDGITRNVDLLESLRKSMQKR